MEYVNTSYIFSSLCPETHELNDLCSRNLNDLPNHAHKQPLWIKLLSHSLEPTQIPRIQMLLCLLKDLPRVLGPMRPAGKLVDQRLR